MERFNEYLKNTDICELLHGLPPSYIQTIIKQIKHFTEKEAGRRDQIVLSYFGEKGVEHIVNTVANYLLSPPKPKEDTRILDIGAGNGFFTTKIADRIQKHIPNASFYAVDITPAMLQELNRRTNKVTCFLGAAENLTKAIKHAQKFMDIPDKYDAAYSILTLHHCTDIRKVLRNMKQVLNKNGKAIIIDLHQHPYREFREEMGDIHLGFKPEHIVETAKKFFTHVSIEKIPGTRCQCTQRTVQLFAAYLIP